MGETEDLLFLCALRLDGEGLDWNVVAREMARVGSPAKMLRGIVVERSKRADHTRDLLRAALSNSAACRTARERVTHELDEADRTGAWLATVLDEGYPANLRLIPNRPPFLFGRGTLAPTDARAVAVVGTRDATEPGIRRAQRMTRDLVADGVTVVSGLAAGIDTAAHRETLDQGGRTIAVLGTGITKCFPPTNEGLAEEIVASGRGALVSQFWPTTGSSRYTFPRRNVVTSGISQGTVVIEASRTSGAKMQARIALEHGKRVWLVHSLVTDQPWAQEYVANRGAVAVIDTGTVISELRELDEVMSSSEAAVQMSLEAL